MGYTHITGLSSSLPTETIRLPLKYSSDWYQNKDTNLGQNAEVGGFLPTDNTDSAITAIYYRVLSDFRTIYLTPITETHSSSFAEHRQIKVELPRKIFNRRTICFQYTSLASLNEPQVAIDLLDEDYLFISLLFRLENFYGGSKSRISVENVIDWAHISVPYSFELRSEPYYLTALDHENLIITLKDSGLLHFKRKAPLGDFEIFNFSNGPSASRKLFNNIFSSSKLSTRGSDLSSKTTVEVLKVNDDQLLALSLDKSLALYNIRHHTIEKIYTYLWDGKEASSPSRYLQDVTHSPSARRFILSMGSSVVCENDTNNKYVSLTVLEILRDSITLCDHLNSVIPVPAVFKEKSNLDGIVYVDDVLAYSTRDVITLKVLWRCNSFTIFSDHELDPLTGSTKSIGSSVGIAGSLSSLKSDDWEPKSLPNLLWESGKYDIDIIRSAIHIFFEAPTCDVARIQASEIIAFTETRVSTLSASTGVSPKSLWSKFHLVCEELRRSGQKPLSLHLVSGMVMCAQMNGIGIHRKSHFFEDISSNCASSTLNAILNVLKARVSSSTMRQIRKFFESPNVLLEDRISDFAQSILMGKFCEAEIGMVLEKIDTNVLSLIHQLSAKPIIDVEQDFERSADNLSTFSKLYAINTFRSVIESHRSFLLHVAILFFMCEINSEIVNVLRRIHDYLSKYNILERMFETSFCDNNALSLEKDSIRRLDLSVFWWIVGDRENLVNRIKKHEMVEAFDVVCHSFLTEEFDILISSLILRLIDCDEWDFAHENFGMYLNVANQQQRYIRGILSLFMGNFEDFGTYCTDPAIMSTLRESRFFSRVLPNLSPQSRFKSIFHLAHAEVQNADEWLPLYFHSLSQLCVGYSSSGSLPSVARPKFIAQAVLLESNAVKLFHKSSNQPPLKHQKNLFELSLKIRNFEGSLEALESISTQVERTHLKRLFFDLLSCIISSNSQNLLFETKLSRYLARHYNLIDSTLLEIANDDLVLWRSLKTYQVLYAWRIRGSVALCNNSFGNLRGALESLYIFITRFRMEKESFKKVGKAWADYRRFKLKILELYMIIINGVRSLKNEDERWIRRQNGQKFEIVDINTLTSEYLGWLQELEDELPTSIDV
ncbi:hypothetical protein CAJCM15448_14520 [Candidozyma auris]|nr:hypothetical protein CAJCM15448_14520 [[Candida] auris]